MSTSWENTTKVQGVRFTCGYCGALTSPREKYDYVRFDGHFHTVIAEIFICPGCNSPTYKIDRKQIPGPLIGRNVRNLPELINDLYRESRQCFSVEAYTSSVLACRKLLMNIAVQEGAPENKKFIEYVNFLEENNYTPPKGRQWVDKIRSKGNEATHEINPMTIEDARELLTFVELLLIYVYEFPSTVQSS
ncbi:hypothetical protein D3C74_228260 [compost metagenome]